MLPDLTSQVNYNTSTGQPWVQVAGSGPDSIVPGWWYNLGITGVRVELLPTRPTDLLVQYVFTGSPADGVLQPGDIVMGAGSQPFQTAHQNGYGPAVFGAAGPISDFAVALEASQTPTGGGQLQVTIERNGSTLSPTIPVGTAYGAYAATYPDNCPKSARVINDLLAFLLTQQDAQGSWGEPHNDTFAALAMMASGTPAHMAAASRCVNYLANATTGKDHRSLINWTYAAAAIVIAEYYLLTNDASLLPELQEIHDHLAWAQFMDRSTMAPWVLHRNPTSYPIGPFDLHGGWGHTHHYSGYGPIAMITGQGAIAYALLDRCRINVRRKRLDAAYAFLQRGTGPNGYLWYGDRVANPNSWADTGRTGASALAHLLSPYSGGNYQTHAQLHLTMMGLYPESFPDTHAEPVMGMGYVAAAVAWDPAAFRRTMDANRYWFALAQCHDGTFYYQPNRDNSGYGADSRIKASALTALTFQVHKRNLAITGR